MYWYVKVTGIAKVEFDSIDIEVKVDHTRSLGAIKDFTSVQPPPARWEFAMEFEVAAKDEAGAEAVVDQIMSDPGSWVVDATVDGSPLMDMVPHLEIEDYSVVSIEGEEN